MTKYIKSVFPGGHNLIFIHIHFLNKQCVGGGGYFGDGDTTRESGRPYLPLPNKFRDNTHLATLLHHSPNVERLRDDSSGEHRVRGRTKIVDKGVGFVRRTFGVLLLEERVGPPLLSLQQKYTNRNCTFTPLNTALLPPAHFA